MKNRAINPDKNDKKSDTPEMLPIDVGGFAPVAGWKMAGGVDPRPGDAGRRRNRRTPMAADAVWVDHSKHAMRLYLAALKPDGSLDGALKAAAVAPDVRGAIWAPNSGRILAFTEKPNNESDLGPGGAAWLVDPAALDKPAKLEGVPPTVELWRCSGGPDGGEIAFAALTPGRCAARL